LDQALRELQAQENARNQKTEELKRKSTEVFFLLELFDLNLILIFLISGRCCSTEQSEE